MVGVEGEAARLHGLARGGSGRARGRRVVEGGVEAHPAREGGVGVPLLEQDHLEGWGGGGLTSSFLMAGK